MIKYLVSPHLSDKGTIKNNNFSKTRLTENFHTADYYLKKKKKASVKNTKKSSSMVPTNTASKTDF